MLKEFGAQFTLVLVHSSSGGGCAGNRSKGGANRSKAIVDSSLSCKWIMFLIDSEGWEESVVSFIDYGVHGLRLV